MFCCRGVVGDGCRYWRSSRILFMKICYLLRRVYSARRSSVLGLMRFWYMLSSWLVASNVSRNLVNMFIAVYWFFRRSVVDSPTARHLYEGLRSWPRDLVLGFSWVLHLYCGGLASWFYLEINSWISRSSCHSKSAHIL